MSGYFLTKNSKFVKLIVMKSDLTQILSPTRTKKLQEAGINSIYSLLTFFPRRLQYISPLTSSYQDTSEDRQYFFDGVLQKIEHRRGKRSFLVLYFSGEFNFSGFYFVTSRYIHQKLKVGNHYQVLVNKKNNLWTIQKVEEYKNNPDEINFIVGRAIQKDYILPIYPKTGALKSSYYIAIHRQLPRQIYDINIEGLIPPNDLIDGTINLYNIHHPITLEEYRETRDQWTILNVFLKLSLMKYMNTKQKLTQTRAGTLDIDFLKDLSSSLPYTLSNSQKTVIWDIVNELTIN